MIGRVEVDQGDLTRLVRALNKEADGRELRRDLVEGLKAAVEPAAQQARASILSMGTHGLVQAVPPLRAAVAAGVKVRVRLGGKSAGVSVVAGKGGMPRGFAQAPKRLNARGWRHPVFSPDVWETQVGKPGWFDDTLDRARPAALRAAQDAMDGMAKRIEQHTKS
ncbi:MAG TPA: hypothetical protein DGT23_35250 [Micromonosporaceae bacterium]|nr:hypothetical protein [Micromonosporaceae bacterium]